MSVTTTNDAGKQQGDPSPLASTLGRQLNAAAKVLFSVSVTIIGLLLVTFIIGRVMPVDPVLAVVGDKASAEIYEAARIKMGLDRPIYEQFFLYLYDVLRGDLGVSTLTARPVLDDIIRVFPATLELATIATIIGVFFGIPAGVIAAVHQGRWPDQIIRVLGLIGYSMPVFWLGLMGLSLFYGQWDLVAGPGRLDVFYEDIVPAVSGLILLDAALDGNWEIFWNAVSHIILPASILGYYSLAYISRMTRSFMLEQLSQEYITTARVKGLSERAVIWGHAVRNVMVPLITVVALSYANLLEGSVLTEIVFSWPGIGSYITIAILSADMAAVLGGTIVIGIVFIGINLFSDFLYRFVDPRAK